MSWLHRTLLFAAITMMAATWVYASALELRGEQLAHQIATGRVAADEFDPVPLSTEATRTAAQRLLAEHSDNHDRIDRLLARSLAQRPLYAPYWLDRAETARRAGDAEAAEKYLETAVALWPNRPILLWKAAMVRAQIGRADATLESLRNYLRAAPGGYQKALAVAMRLEPEPAALLPAVLPDLLGGQHSRDDLVRRILRSARSRKDLELGLAAWRELSPDARRNPENVRAYVEWMAAANRRPEALSAWASYRATPDPLILENGGFEHRLDGGLDWLASDRGGITLTRDSENAYRGQYSLKVTFPGNENLHFAHLRQYLPVQPATDYTLSFAWRGENVTTRSGPYMEILGQEAGGITRTEDRWGTWDWERRELAFTSPATEQFLVIRLRRNRTNALDNEIGGALWLDDFSLTAHTAEARSG